MEYRYLGEQNVSSPRQWSDNLSKSTHSSAAPVVVLKTWLGVRLRKTQTEAREPLDDRVEPQPPHTPLPTNSRSADAKTEVLTQPPSVSGLVHLDLQNGLLPRWWEFCSDLLQYYWITYFLSFFWLWAIIPGELFSIQKVNVCSPEVSALGGCNKSPCNCVLGAPPFVKH